MIVYLLGPLLILTYNPLRISITKISRLGAKIIKLVDELDVSEGNAIRDLCIYLKKVGWNPDITVMNANSI